MISYEHARANTTAARNARNYAGAALDLASIRERMAELVHQSEPLCELTAGNDEERARINAAVFYVVVGRFPEQSPPAPE